MTVELCGEMLPDRGVSKPCLQCFRRWEDVSEPSDHGARAEWRLRPKGTCSHRTFWEHAAEAGLGLNVCLYIFPVCRFGPTAARRHRQLSQHPLQGDSGRKLAVREEGYDQRHPPRPEVSPKLFVQLPSPPEDWS